MNYIETFKEYEDLAARTDVERPSPRDAIVYHALKLAGEAGEVADYVGKWYGQGHDFDAQKLNKELGDVLWHLTRLSKAVGFLLGHVAYGNIEKLKARYPAGFSTEASVKRVDTGAESKGDAKES